MFFRKWFTSSSTTSDAKALNEKLLPPNAAPSDSPATPPIEFIEVDTSIDYLKEPDLKFDDEESVLISRAGEEAKDLSLPNFQKDAGASFKEIKVEKTIKVDVLKDAKPEWQDWTVIEFQNNLHLKDQTPENKAFLAWVTNEIECDWNSQMEEEKKWKYKLFKFGSKFLLAISPRQNPWGVMALITAAPSAAFAFTSPAGVTPDKIGSAEWLAQISNGWILCKSVTYGGLSLVINTVLSQEFMKKAFKNLSKICHDFKEHPVITTSELALSLSAAGSSLVLGYDSFRWLLTISIGGAAVSGGGLVTAGASFLVTGATRYQGIKDLYEQLFHQSAEDKFRDQLLKLFYLIHPKHLPAINAALNKEYLINPNILHRHYGHAKKYKPFTERAAIIIAECLEEEMKKDEKQAAFREKTRTEKATDLTGKVFNALLIIAAADVGFVFAEKFIEFIKILKPSVNLADWAKALLGVPSGLANAMMYISSAIKFRAQIWDLAHHIVYHSPTRIKDILKISLIIAGNAAAATSMRNATLSAKAHPNIVPRFLMQEDLVHEGAFNVNTRSCLAAWAEKSNPTRSYLPETERPVLRQSLIDDANKASAKAQTAMKQQYEEEKIKEYHLQQEIHQKKADSIKASINVEEAKHNNDFEKAKFYERQYKQNVAEIKAREAIIKSLHAGTPHEQKQYEAKATAYQAQANLLEAEEKIDLAFRNNDLKSMSAHQETHKRLSEEAQKLSPHIQDELNELQNDSRPGDDYYLQKPDNVLDLVLQDLAKTTLSGYTVEQVEKCSVFKTAMSKSTVTNSMFREGAKHERRGSVELEQGQEQPQPKIKTFDDMVDDFQGILPNAAPTPRQTPPQTPHSADPGTMPHLAI